MAKSVKKEVNKEVKEDNKSEMIKKETTQENKD